MKLNHRLEQVMDRFGIDPAVVIPYGRDMAKIPWDYKGEQEQHAKLVLVTAITPTPLGEGKTTVSIGLTDGLNLLGQKTTVVLREPSLGPVFGRKGGATGGNAASIIPEDKINLHFTGDFHAITAAHNLIAAMIEQRLFFGDTQIDPQQITWKRAIDMNDRHLRQLTITIDATTSYQSGFQITAASEIMAIFCLARSYEELGVMLDQMIFGYDFEGKPLMVRMLNITGALCALLKDAIDPNIVTTKEGNLALVHGGPFANIAHGCNSIFATQLALNLGDIVVTEAGFGSDLGAEKFLDIKMQRMGRVPNAVVLVATIRALKYHSGMELAFIADENTAAVEVGLGNLQKHIANMRAYGVPLIVTLNQFSTDTAAEIAVVRRAMEMQGVRFAVNTAFLAGGSGAEELAREVLAAMDTTDMPVLKRPYALTDTIEAKIDKLTRSIYGATRVVFSEQARGELEQIRPYAQDLPICVAKTPEAFTQTPQDRGLPRPYEAEVRRVKLAHGAGMIIVYMGKIIDMPGLPRVPQAHQIYVDQAMVTRGTE